MSNPEANPLPPGWTFEPARTHETHGYLRRAADGHLIQAAASPEQWEAQISEMEQVEGFREAEEL